LKWAWRDVGMSLNMEQGQARLKPR
jgi:hypothetical protein